jgi:hypothetical protein
MDVYGCFKIGITLTVGRNSLLSALQMLNVRHRSFDTSMNEIIN